MAPQSKICLIKWRRHRLVCYRVSIKPPIIQTLKNIAKSSGTEYGSALNLNWCKEEAKIALLLLSKSVALFFFRKLESARGRGGRPLSSPPKSFPSYFLSSVLVVVCHEERKRETSARAQSSLAVRCGVDGERGGWLVQCGSSMEFTWSLEEHFVDWEIQN